MTYRAPLELTVRAKRVGGGSAVATMVYGDPSGFRRLTIWIHGFNNPQDDMREKWRETHRLLQKKPGIDLDRTVWFFWPGEMSRARLRSAIVYFMEVEDAVWAGKELADYLQRIKPRNNGLVVNLVAHSLGCRVALEAARNLQMGDGPEVGSLVLMAAAVPEGLCEKGGLYGPDKLASHEVLLHSHNDVVLRRAFPVGQLLARRLRGDTDPGEAHKAVGFTGGPPGRWKPPRQSCGYGHHDYWTGEQSLSVIESLYRAWAPDRLPASRPDDARVADARTPAARTVRARSSLC